MLHAMLEGDLPVFSRVALYELVPSKDIDLSKRSVDRDL